MSSARNSLITILALCALTGCTATSTTAQDPPTASRPMASTEPTSSSPSPTSAAESPEPAPEPRPLDAADGSDIEACIDGACEVTVYGEESITVETRGGPYVVNVDMVVTWVDLSFEGPITDFHYIGEPGVSVMPGAENPFAVSAEPGQGANLNGAVDILVDEIGDGEAVLTIRPAA